MTTDFQPGQETPGSDPDRYAGRSQAGVPSHSGRTRLQIGESARSMLNGRVLLAVGSKEQHTYPELIQVEATSLDTTGMVVNGAGWATTLWRIRASHPNLFLICDPAESERHFASADDPFPQGDAKENHLVPPATLESRVQDQINAGASVAMTPTGYIRAGDRAALKAVITDVSKLERDDVVVLLPLDYRWLVSPALNAIVAAVRRCKHPVAITLGDASRDPMSHPGVLEGAHALAALDSPPMFHKTDLAGLDVMAHGALAASVGVIASKRRAAIPGRSPYAPRTKKGATLLLPDLLRFRRSLDMQDQWYASRNAPSCQCRACNGQPIDRFGSEDYDNVSAAQHNAAGIIGYINNAHASGGFAAYWPDKVRAAIVAHATLSQYVGTQIDPPKELEAWYKTLPGDALRH